MKLRECFERRLLRKESPDLDRSKRSIEIAETKLIEAEKALKYEIFDATIILAYTSMFHAARSILFRDGIVEKSHVCLSEYLKNMYVNTGKLSEASVNALDNLRIDRHETIYGLETKSTRKEAEFSVAKAKEFLETLKTLTESK